MREAKKYHIKKWEDNGRIFLFDLHRFNFLEIDQITSDVLDLCASCNAKSIIEKLNSKYDEADVQEVLAQLEQLESRGVISVAGEAEVELEIPEHTLHLVSHIHWDREWYLAFQPMRIRMVELVDHVLDVLETDSAFNYYMLDGQTVLLEDYLELRPENRERLKNLIQQGRLLIGPWYVQTHPFLVSGEALIRNLMLGHQTAAEFGPVIKVGYLPDATGHIAQLPQILQGFNIDNAVIYRGVGAKREELKTEYLWRAPDGTSVLLVCMPGGFNLANTEKLIGLPNAYSNLRSIQEEYIPRTTTSHLLLMSNTFTPLTDLPKLATTLNILLEPAKVIHSSMPQYLEAVRQANPKLEVISGELSDCRCYSLGLGILSTRMLVKQENAEVQITLEKWAEPFSAFAWLFGAEYPATSLLLAWKYLLHNQFEDNIRGSCLDETEQQTQTRFQWALEIAEMVTFQRLRMLSMAIDTSDFEEATSFLVVYNPLSFRRTDLVTATIDVPWNVSIDNIALYDANGVEVPFQIGKYETTAKADFQPIMRPIHTWTKQVELSFIAGEVPACGYKTYQLCFQKEEEKTPPCSLRSPTPSAYGLEESPPPTLENERLKIQIKRNGTFTLIDKKTGAIYEDCHLFEDTGDAGDTYTFSPPLWDTIFTSSDAEAKIELVSNGPVYTQYKVTLQLQLPEQLVPEEEIPEEVFQQGLPLEDLKAFLEYPSRIERSPKLVECQIISYFTLAKGAKRLDIVTEVHNWAKEHRLRVLFPSSLTTDFSYADAPFAVMERPIELPYFGGQEEDAVTTYPLYTFVDVNDGEKGLALLSQGLSEYEVKADERRTIALTLLRSVGWLNRDNLLNRRRHLAPNLQTPLAQCLGEYTFHYAIAPHADAWESARVYQQALQCNVPMRVVQTDKHEGILEKELSFVTVEPEELIISAIKKAVHEENLIIRLYNISTRNIKGRLQLSEPVLSAHLVNLNEEPIGKELTVTDDGSIHFEVQGLKIVTISICIEKEKAFNDLQFPNAA